MIKMQKLGNILTLKTGIPAKYKDEQLVALDDKKDKVFEVTFSDNPYLSRYGLGANAIIDDELAVVMAVDPETPDELIKKKLGLAVVAANAWIPVIVDGKTAEEEVINSVFEF